MNVYTPVLQPNTRRSLALRSEHIPLGVRLSVVHGLTITRFFAAIVFAAVGNIQSMRMFATYLLIFAAATDLIDGYMSRRLRIESYFGKILDLVADKALTAVCLVYVASSGVSVAPLALIAAREIFMIGMRSIIFDGKQLLPTNRTFGGVIAGCLWLSTVAILSSPPPSASSSIANLVFWGCAIAVGGNLVLRVWTSWTAIRTLIVRSVE